MQNQKTPNPKRASQRKWNQANRTVFRFELYGNNADMIEFLKSQENVTGYLKSLIRADMELHGLHPASTEDTTTD